jgi:endonuclease III
MKLKPKQWESMIAGVNYYKNKAKNIYKMAGMLNDNAKNINHK